MTTNQQFGKVSGKDLKNILITDIKAHLEMLDTEKFRKRPTYFVLGETGNGKTQIVHQVGEQLGLQVVELNLGNALDPTEITGVRVPIKDDESWILKLVPIEEIQKAVDSGKPFILFLDELGAEAPSMRNFLLKLTDERKLNGIDVSKAYIVAAGNPPGKDYGTRELEAALRGRMSIFECRLSPNEVADYFEYLGNDKEPELRDEYKQVATFLRNKPSLFNGSDGDARSMINPARCARAYHYSVHTIKEYQDEPKIQMILLQGLLGPATGRELSDFVQNTGATTYSPEQILQGEFDPVKNRSQWRVTLENVLAYLGENNIPLGRKGADNFVKFMEAGEPDLQNGMFRSISRNDYNLPSRAQTVLLSKIEEAGLASDAELGEE